MDHAEVLDRIEGAFLSPGKLRAIEVDRSAGGEDLRRHLEGCADCPRELAAWRAAAQALNVATPDTVVASPDARARLLATVAASTRPMPAPLGHADAPAPASRARAGAGVPSLARIALAAAAAVLLFVSGALLGGPLGITPVPTAPPPAQDAGAIVVAAVDRVLARPEHRVVPMGDEGGARTGTLLFDEATRELVVLSRSLEPAPSGSEYHCFVERAGERTWVGRMQEYEGTSWWVGPLDEPIDAGSPGDRFLVILEGSTAPALSGGF